MATPSNGIEEHKPGLLSPLSKVEQEAFVATAQEIARAGIVLAFGVIIGVVFAWVSGIRSKKK